MTRLTDARDMDAVMQRGRTLRALIDDSLGEILPACEEEGLEVFPAFRALDIVERRHAELCANDAEILMEAVSAVFAHPMVQEIWSVSRIRKAAQCLRAYGKWYREKEREDARDKLAARLGKLVHNVLEQTYREVLDAELIGAFPRHRAIEIFESSFASSGINGEEEFAEGLRMIRNHAMLQGMVDWRSVLAVEDEFRIDFGGVPMRGFWDRVDMVDEHGRLSEDDILIRDYKSGKWMHSDAELDSDLQASVYIDAARRRWPGKRVRFSFEMVRHGHESIVERADEQIEDAQRYVRAIVRRVADATAAARFEARISSLCPWCSHRHDCEEYGMALERDIGSFPPEQGLALERLVRHRHRATSIQSIARQHVARADRLLKVAVEQHGGSLHARNEVVRISRRKYPNRATYKLDTVVKIMLAAEVDTEEAIRKGIAGVDHRRLSRFITSRTKDWRPADVEALKLKIHASGRMSFESYIDVRDDH